MKQDNLVKVETIVGVVDFPDGILGYNCVK